MSLKKLGHRGAILTEYIIILAFIGAIAASFVSDGGLVDAVKEAASIAKEDIIVALGGERPSKKLYSAKMAEGSEKYKNLVDDVINSIFNVILDNDIPLDTVSQIYLKVNNQGEITELKVSHLPVGGYFTQTSIKNLEQSSFMDTSKYNFANGNTQIMMNQGEIIDKSSGNNPQYTRLQFYEIDTNTNTKTEIHGYYNMETGEFSIAPKK